MAARGDSGRSSPGRGGGGGGGGVGPRPPLGAGLGRFGGAHEPDPRPGRSPSLPGALPRGRRCTQTQSRVCLARERCPWLHNSPDGIGPGVFLNRAAKKCELSVGRGLRPPPLWGLRGGRVGFEKTGVSQALSGVCLGDWSEGLGLPRGRGGGWGREDGIAGFDHSGVP